jgi:hypothetical protein
MTLADAEARFKSERALIEAGIAGKFKATSQQGDITPHDWAALQPLLGSVDNIIARLVRWGANEIQFEPGNIKTGILLETDSKPPLRPPRRRRRQRPGTAYQLIQPAVFKHLEDEGVPQDRGELASLETTIHELLAHQKTERSESTARRWAKLLVGEFKKRRKGR